MIKTKEELKLYVTADRVIAGLSSKPSFQDTLKDLLSPNYTQRYLKSMRIVSYYSNTNRTRNIMCLIHKSRFKKLGIKLGFSIGYNCFGYALLIPHYGTIVVNGTTRAGNYCVLHTSTCIGGSDKKIGNAMYLASGSKIMKENIILGDNVSIGANSLVNKSFINGNVLLAGAPANSKKHAIPWYERDGERFIERIRRIEDIKLKMKL